MLVSSESTGHLRDPQIINYLFKSVYELTDADENSHMLFSFSDISILVDAFYKSQMDLSDKYGDLFIDILQR